MIKEGDSTKYAAPSVQAGSSSPSSAARRRRRGQTTVEYLLVMVSLLFVFLIMFKALQYALSNQFKRGGMVIIKMYKEDPW